MGHVIMRKTQLRERGSAIMETAFMVPWLFFLFVGVLDLGFYSYAAVRLAGQQGGGDSLHLAAQLLSLKQPFDICCVLLINCAHR